MAFYMQSLTPKNQSFSFEALRAAGYANAAGGDIGEVMAICSRIAPGDEDAWLKEWKGSGDRAVANALATDRGIPIALETFLASLNNESCEFIPRQQGR